jgi:hypothetical protein
MLPDQRPLKSDHSNPNWKLDPLVYFINPLFQKGGGAPEKTMEFVFDFKIAKRVAAEFRKKHNITDCDNNPELSLLNPHLYEEIVLGEACVDNRLVYDLRFVEKKRALHEREMNRFWEEFTEELNQGTEWSSVNEEDLWN